MLMLLAIVILSYWYDVSLCHIWYHNFRRMDSSHATWCLEHSWLQSTSKEQIVNDTNFSLSTIPSCLSLEHLSCHAVICCLLELAILIALSAFTNESRCISDVCFPIELSAWRYWWWLYICLKSQQVEDLGRWWWNWVIRNHCAPSASLQCIKVFLNGLDIPTGKE